MKMISLLLLISISTVHAAPATPVVKKANPSVVTPTSAVTPTSTNTTPPLTGTSSTPTTSSAPAPTPIPWKLAYFGEYFGPRLSNFSLSKTQGPLDAVAAYTAWAHSLKLGYAVSGEVVLGTQIRASSPFDAAKSLTWKNLRFYFSWAHMIDTADIDMRGVVDWELPTSNGARTAGLVTAFNIKNFWTFKTILRNLSFSAMTMIRPMYYNVPSKNADIYLGIFPSIQVDLAPDWAMIVEASFDASHSYNDTFFDFGQNDPDNINIGVQYSFNAHLQINPALKFFTADFSVPILYLGLSASL